MTSQGVGLYKTGDSILNIVDKEKTTTHEKVRKCYTDRKYEEGINACGREYSIKQLL